MYVNEKQKGNISVHGICNAICALVSNEPFVEKVSAHVVSFLFVLDFSSVPVPEHQPLSISYRPAKNCSLCKKVKFS